MVLEINTTFNITLSGKYLFYTKMMDCNFKVNDKSFW